jgi:PAS domain S-box-containing protein
MKIGLIPVILLAVATFYIIIFNPFANYTFDPPYVQFILNFLFITGTGIAIATISGKSYLKDGSANILLLGCAVLVNAFTGFFAGWASSSANVNMTVFSIGILASSILQLTAAHVTVNRGEINWFQKRKSTLITLYVSSILFMVGVCVVSVLELLPPFHTDYGQTLLSEVVLLFAFTFFVCSSFIFIYQYFKTKSSVIYWYSLGLLIISGSIFGTFFAEQFTGVLLWIARCSEYIGGFYFLIALLALRSRDNQNLTLTGKWQEAFITNQKQVANLFSKMLNGFTYCKIITDSNGKPVDWLYIDVNDTFAKSSGHQREDFIGKKGTDISPNLKVECASWLERFGQVALTGKAVIFEDYSKPFKKWFSISAYCPKKGYFVTLSEDITQRKKLEEDIVYSEMKYRRVFETSQDGIIARNLQGRMIDCNKAYAKMLGYSKKELRDHSYTQVLPQKWHEHREVVIKNVLETGHSIIYEREYSRKDGSIFPASVRTWRLTSDEGEVLGVWSTVRDISDQKGYQLKLEEYSKQLEQLVEERTCKLKDAERLAAIGETAGMVGHDIRNPLQSIIADVFLSIQELEALPEGNAKTNLKESLDSIEKQAMYINKIVADLQDYTKLTKPQIEEIPIQQLIEEALSIIPIPENITIKTSIKPGLTKIKSDTNFLKRILTNLCLNAVQAMTYGGTLSIKVTLKKGQALISVQDTGAGIPEEITKNLFKPLFTTKPKGQGFGLAVAKKLTESLKGSITFETIKNVGTTFTITLPQPQSNT